MAAKKKNIIIKLKCETCKRINYYLRKKKNPYKKEKMQIKKFCKWCKKHVLHKEGR